jgi:succinate dehydrogenase / fumarate reductase flavoprotein subunit
MDPVQTRSALRDLEAPLERRAGESPYEVLRDLQAVMQQRVGIFRVQEDLDAALIELADLRKRWQSVCVDGGRTFNPGWNLVFELGNLLTVSEAVARSARQRTESRGAHSRLDFPDTDDDVWGQRNSVVARDGDGRMTVSTAPLPDMDDELRGLLAADH